MVKRSSEMFELQAISLDETAGQKFCIHDVLFSCELNWTMIIFS